MVVKERNSYFNQKMVMPDVTLEPKFILIQAVYQHYLPPTLRKEHFRFP